MAYCHNCKREIHHLGIMSHRAMHKRKKEKVKITLQSGTYIYDFTGEGA